MGTPRLLSAQVPVTRLGVILRGPGADYPTLPGRCLPCYRRIEPASLLVSTSIVFLFASVFVMDRSGCCSIATVDIYVSISVHY